LAGQQLAVPPLLDLEEVEELPDGLGLAGELPGAIFGDPQVGQRGAGMECRDRLPSVAHLLIVFRVEPADRAPSAAGAIASAASPREGNERGRMGDERGHRSFSLQAHARDASELDPDVGRFIHRSSGSCSWWLGLTMAAGVVCIVNTMRMS